MSRYGMPVHKFIRKPEAYISVRTQPPTITWIPKTVQYSPIKQQGGLRWELFAQEAITIEPRTSITIELDFGVQLTRGMCFISLRQNLKAKRCSLQDGAVSEDV